MQQDIPGTIVFDGTEAQKGLALNRMCYSFNSAENRAAFLKRRRRLLPQIRPQRRATRGGQEPQRAEDDRGRRQRLLPRQARRHLRPQCPGHRRATDRHDGRGIQVETSVSREHNHGHNRRRRRLDPRSRDRQGDRGEKAERSLLEAVLQGLRLRPLLAGANEARRRRGVLQRPRAQLLPRQAADLRQSAPPTNIAARTKAGAFRFRVPSRAMRRCHGT